MRYLIYWALRRESARFCKGPRLCHAADAVRCLECGAIRKPAEIDAPGACPECGHPKYERERCADCPHTKMDAALESEVGGLLHAAMALDVSLEAGYTITLADVTVEEWKALQVLRNERARYDGEKNAG